MMRPIRPKKRITVEKKEDVYDYYVISQDDIGKSISIERSWDDCQIFLVNPAKEIDNPNYDAELARYKLAMEKYKKVLDDKEAVEYQEYLKYKKKFEGK